MKLKLAEDKGDGAGGGTTALTTAPADAGKGEGDAGKTALTAGDGKTTETKPDAAAESAKVAAAAAKLEADVAKLELKLPDGVDAKDASLGEFKKAAAEFGLDTVKAQRMFDLHHKTLSAAVTAREKSGAEARATKLDQTVAGWKESLKTDKDFGGAKLPETHADVARVMKKYGDDKELRQMLDETGWGDHPGLVKLIARIGRDMREDKLVSGQPGAGGKKTLPELLYGSPPKS